MYASNSVIEITGVKAKMDNPQNLKQQTVYDPKDNSFFLYLVLSAQV